VKIRKRRRWKQQRGERAKGLTQERRKKVETAYVSTVSGLMCSA
jgi:hypothetical protein